VISTSLLPPEIEPYRALHRNVRYAFGYGLSYTTFAFDAVQADRDSITADGQVTVRFDVSNTGKGAGSMVAQVYTVMENAELSALGGYSSTAARPQCWAFVRAAAPCPAGDPGARCRTLLIAEDSPDVREVL
jgi:hypothetical protein